MHWHFAAQRALRVKQPADASAMAAKWLEQLEHPRVGAAGFAPEAPADEVRQMQISGRYGVRIGGAVREDHLGGPRPNTANREQARA